MKYKKHAGKRHASIVLILGSAIVLSSCQSNPNKQQTGTAIGAVGGAVVGSLFGSGKGKVLGVVLGAAAGAWLGNRIGQQLDEQDRQNLAMATQTSAVSGQGQSWANPDTGVKGTTRVLNTVTEREQQPISYKKSRIKKMPPLELIGEKYAARSAVNVRGGPSTDYAVLNGLSTGQEVEVVGRVENKNWYVIGNDGVADGFVSSRFLSPTGEAAVSTSNSNTDSDVITASVDVARKCREIEQVVVLKNGSEVKEQVRACQGPDGWVVQA